jgi:hypothetical protein
MSKTESPLWLREFSAAKYPQQNAMPCLAGMEVALALKKRYEAFDADALRAGSCGGTLDKPERDTNLDKGSISWKLEESNGVYGNSSVCRSLSDTDRALMCETAARMWFSIAREAKKMLRAQLVKALQEAKEEAEAVLAAAQEAGL